MLLQVLSAVAGGVLRALVQSLRRVRSRIWTGKYAEMCSDEVRSVLFQKGFIQDLDPDPTFQIIQDLDTGCRLPPPPLLGAAKAGRKPNQINSTVWYYQRNVEYK